MVNRGVFPLIKKSLPVITDAGIDVEGGLYQLIASDLFRLNQHYRLLPGHCLDDLLTDVNYLLTQGIAAEIQFIFYNPINSQQVYLKKTYRVNDNTQDRSPVDPAQYTIPEPFEFDIFVAFTPLFNQMDVAARTAVLGDFTFSWFGMEQFNLKPDHSSATQLDGDRMGSDFPLTAPVASVSPAAITLEASADLDVMGLSALDKRLFQPLMQQHFLQLATYSDSRQLIQAYHQVAEKMHLNILEWSCSDGFSCGTRYGAMDEGNNVYQADNQLGPVAALRWIKDRLRPQTIYLLEDFHHYLQRENVTAEDYVEIISIIKSLPRLLKLAESFVVILSPTINLPAEIATIVATVDADLGGGKQQYLNRFGIDLAEVVADKTFKSVIGRDVEIFECLKILSKLEGNNPLLVGKSGVGKTAIIEGLALRMLSQEVPAHFRQKKIISLNMNAMISGTKYRGEFERRLEGLIAEVKQNVQSVIVFIDEIHTILNMGSTEGSAGAENVLKPALARGDFPCIGATTTLEYQKYIAPDKALARRFQVIEVDEPSAEQTIKILQGIKSVYENYHQIRIEDQAIIRCVELSDKMLGDQYFPGKAIKILDSVCATATLLGKKAVTPDLVVKEFRQVE